MDVLGPIYNRRGAIPDLQGLLFLENVGCGERI
jgi:hypothetical protein